MVDKLYKNPALQLSIVAVGGLLLLGYLFYWVLGRDGLRPPGELAEEALTAADETARERAAADLAGHPEAKVELLRDVWNRSHDVRVKSAVAIGLGTRRDWESMPQLIAALEDESQLLRGRCSQAINDIAEEDFGFRAGAPDNERAAAVAEIKKKWQTLQGIDQAKQKLLNAGQVPDKWKQRLEDRQ